jgi:pimeloyl-ACP methyl ester carboxylesterase
VGDRIRAAVQPPSLVIAGDQDLLTGVEPVATYARILGASYTLIERCGHYPWIEQPHAFRHRLDAWLNSLSESAP